MKNGPSRCSSHALVVAFMLAPLVVVCLVAFTPADTLQVPWGAYSLRWFRAVFEHGDLVQSFWNSLAVATLAATLAVLLAVPGGAGHRAARVPRPPGAERPADEPADRAAPGAGRGHAAAVCAARRARLGAVADAGARGHRHALRAAADGGGDWPGRTAASSRPRCRWAPAAGPCSAASRCR
jgi:hypothetical protein